jgi:trimethylamine:corrinoid methyltransferase-like protein
LLFALDMRSGRGMQSSIEALQAATLAVQLMKRGFGLMTHSYGAGSDSPDVDCQSQAERVLLGLMVALAGADILGGAGQLECATVLSPVQLVIDCEVAAMMRQYLHTPDATDESVAWDDLLEIETGDHFLARNHTLAHCREHFVPEAFARLTRESYQASVRRDMLTNARDICRQLLSREPMPGLPDAAAVAEIGDIVAAADRHIGQ